MTAVPAGTGPRPAERAPRPALEELLHGVRQALAARDEDPTGAWVEETAAELSNGSKPGWLLPGPSGGVAFYARRDSAAFAHLHSTGGLPVAAALAGALLGNLPGDLASVDLGFSGLSPEEERELAAGLARRPGSTVIGRAALERALLPADGRFAPEPPAGVERLPSSAVTVDAFAELDRAAFRGTIDELLLGREPEAYRRALQAMLDGRLGRFLAEASAVLVEPEPTRLVGAVLSAERSTRRAIVLELAVDPERRRRGLGRYLLGWTLRALWALGYESVRLWVSVDNAPAFELYRAFGFRPKLEATIYRWDRGSVGAHPHRSA